MPWSGPWLKAAVLPKVIDHQQMVAMALNFLRDKDYLHKLCCSKCCAPCLVSHPLLSLSGFHCGIPGEENPPLCWLWILLCLLCSVNYGSQSPGV